MDQMTGNTEIIEVEDREEAITRMYDAAFDEGKACDHCDGTGRVSGGRKLVHSMAGMFGADHDIESVAADIRRADRVAWVHHWNDHDLGIEVDGRAIVYAVPHPEKRDTA